MTCGANPMVPTRCVHPHLHESAEHVDGCVDDCIILGLESVDYLLTNKLAHAKQTGGGRGGEGRGSRNSAQTVSNVSWLTWAVQ